MTVSKQDLIVRVAQSAIDVVRAEHEFKEARAVIRGQFEEYFRKHGRPEGQFLPYAPEWKDVTLYTAVANRKRTHARNVLKNAKARMERAVRALERGV